VTRDLVQQWQLRRPPAALATRWTAAGLWDDATLGDLLEEHLRAQPEQGFAVHSLIRPARGTYADVTDEARRVAGGLLAHGIGPGDVVACQLPNWREAATVIYGACLLGAVVVPIVHFYGRREVDYILERTGVRALVTAGRFGRLTYLDDAADRPALRALDLLAVVGDETLPAGAIAYETLVGVEPWLDRADVDPDAPAVVAYTSGTTAEPKGVVHTHRTMGAEVRQIAPVLPPRPPRLTVSPVGHVGGMLTGLFTPLLQGLPINLLDVWDADRVLDLMLAEGVSAGSGATFFLTSLLDHPGLTAAHRALMPYVSMGGAAVPEGVARRAAAEGLCLTRNYGSTEHPTTTGARPTDPEEGRLTTDGRPLPGVELRLVDDDGQEVGVGEPGEILSRGPDLFVGYTDPALTAAALDAEGWYRSGDIGVLDADGNLTITDRKKDVIIRGGENISAVEVEEVLARLPLVSEVAVVGVPDAKYGEHVCAVIKLRDAASALHLEDVRSATAAAGLGRQKWPEELRIVTDFPRTPSGKIRKRDLRDQLRASAG
jgi:acyl-CoA synthetase (AMP-forming)/AMP-acid ligase II